MAKLQQFLLFCGLLAFATCQQLVENSKENLASDYSSGTKLVSRSAQCGNEIWKESFGRIEYKVDQPLEPNERCVWLIRVANASSYTVGVFSFGLPESSVDHSLTITRFATDIFVAENTRINDTGMFTVNGPVLLVTLHTATSSNISNFRGFSLSYETHLEGSQSVASAYEDMFYDATNEERRWLGAGSGLNPHSLCFLVYNWGAKPSSPQNRIKLTYGRGEMWTSANYVELYVFEATSGWNLRKTFNSEQDFETFESSDLVVVVGRSRSTAANTFMYYLANYFCKDDEIV